MVSWRQVKKALDQANDIDDILKGYVDLNRKILDPVVDVGAKAGGIWLDNPYGKRVLGNARYANSKWGMGAVPNNIADIMHMMTLGITDNPEDYDSVVKAYEQGFGDFTGGRAAWEATQGQKNALSNALFDIAADPTTIATVGAGAAPGGIARGSAIAARGGLANELLGTAVKGTFRTAKVVNIPDKVIDQTAAKFIGKTSKTKVGRYITELSPREKVRRSLDSLFPQYKTAKMIESNNVAQDVFNVTRALGPNTMAHPGVNDQQRMLQNAWNAASNRPVTAQDVGDTIIERGPFASPDPATPVSIADLANRTKTDTDEVRRIVNLLGSEKWDKAAKREDVEKLVQQFASGNLVKNRKINPANDTNVRKALAGISTDIRPFRKNETRDAYRQYLESVGTSVGSRKTPLDPMDVDNALMVYDDFFTAHPQLQQSDIDSMMSVYDEWSPTGQDVFSMSDEDIFKSTLSRRMATDTTIQGLGNAGNDALHQVFKVGKFKGKTYWQALNELEVFFDESKRIVEDAVGPGAWKRKARRDDIEKTLEESGDKNALKIWQEWANEGVDLLHHPKEESVFSYFEQFVYGNEGVDTTRKKTRLSAIASVWKGQALLSPRYHTSNIISAYFNTLLTYGPEALPSPKEFWEQIRFAIRDDPDRLDTFFPDSTINDTLTEYGMARVNPNIGHGGMSSTTDAQSRDQIEKAFGRIIGQPLGKVFGPVMDFNRRMGIAIDATARGRVWDTKLRAVFGENEQVIRNEIERTAQRQGLVLDPDLDTMPFKDPEHAIGYYRGLGFTEGNARHLSREIARVRNLADKEAIAQVHKGLFSYYRTRGDELLSKVIPFHYYASRSTALYMEEMARNPVLLRNFANMADEMFRDYEESGMDARQKGWIKVMGSHFGFAMLMNPDALLGFTRGMGLMGDNYQNDETQLGGILRWMKAGGFGMYPWVDGMFNMMGTYGDTFEPDALGVRHRALVGSALNWIGAEAGLTEGYGSAPYAELNAKARQHVSTWASAFLPEWLAQPVQVKANDSGTIAEASYEKLIESRVIYNNPNLTNQQLFEIMNDPDSDEHREAQREISRSGVLNQLIAFTIPIGVKTRESSTDVRGAVLSAHYDAAKKAGINANEVNPRADAEFASRYKATTGKDWSPKDFDKAQLESSLISATPQARPYILQLEQYKMLGSPLGRKTMEKYNDIKYGNDQSFGQFPEDQWEDVANLWLSKQPASAQAEMRETQIMQTMFRQQHPEIDTYKNWTSQMSYLERLSGGSLALYRERVSRGNPNAAAYFEKEKNELMKKHRGDMDAFLEAMDRSTTTFDAYLAINGINKKQSDQTALPVTNNSVPYDPGQQMVDDAQQNQPKEDTRWADFLQRF